MAWARVSGLVPVRYFLFLSFWLLFHVNPLSAAYLAGGLTLSMAF